jgi:hypothetical protein
MPDVLEATGLREFDGRVLTVVVEALEPPDVTQLGVGDDDARESSRYVDRGGRSPVDLHDSSLNLIRLSTVDSIRVNIDPINMPIHRYGGAHEGSRSGSD